MCSFQNLGLANVMVVKARPVRGKRVIKDPLFTHGFRCLMKEVSRVVLMHAFNPSTREAERDRQISVSSRPAWSTEQVPGQVPKL